MIDNLFDAIGEGFIAFIILLGILEFFKLVGLYKILMLIGL